MVANILQKLHRRK